MSALESRPRTRPIDVMVAGAQKAGTTSLKEYLGGVPGGRTHSAREFVYFVNDEEYERGYDTFAAEVFGDGPSELAEDVLVAKSVGVMYLPQALERLREHNPGVQIVLLLREPVARAYSAYWYARRLGWEPLKDFETAFHAGVERFADDWVRARGCAYDERGRYAFHLRHIFELFPRSQVHVQLFEDFVRDPAQLCRQVWSRVGLAPEALPNVARRHNAAALPRSEKAARLLATRGPLRRVAHALIPRAIGRQIKSKLAGWNQREFTPPPIDPALRARLVEHYRPHNEELAQLLELDTVPWS